MKLHFIGIGGIGVSAIADYYLKMGMEISGSDLCKSEITKSFSDKGAKIFIGKHKAKNLKEDVDLVVYSLAIKKDNPELKKARRLKIKTQSYPQALGELTKRYFTIAVCGMHGKTTITALLSLILVKAGLDPNVVIGTKLKEFEGSNCRLGESRYLVIEADEYKGAFLNYWPRIIVLASIEREHMDFYRNIRHIFKVFRNFINHLPPKGILVANKDDQNIKKFIRIFKDQKKKIKIILYSLGQKESKRVKEALKIPGDFNVSNSLAALAVARILKISDKISLKALSEYHGAWRRFEIFSSFLNGVPYTLVSDYGHHPTQVRVTLKAAREKFPQRRIILVYQPHQIKRTKILFKDFVRSFDKIDILILNEIYKVSGREFKGRRQLSSEKLASSIQKRWKKLGYQKEVSFTEDQENIFGELKRIIKKNDVIIVMGAGDIYNLVLRLQRTSIS